MPEAPLMPASSTGTPSLRRDAAALALLVLAVVLIRLVSFVPAVVDTDEGLYMVQAREWLRGGWPLVAAWDMHPVGAPAMFALAFLVFGPSVEAARLLGLVCVSLTACGLYAASRVAGAPRAVGIGAGLLYAAQSVLLSGVCTNTEILMAPFMTAAMVVALRAARRTLGPEAAAPGFGAVVAAGLPVGCALLIKQVAFPGGCLAFAVLVGPALARGLLPWRRLLAMAALYAVLCAGPFLLMGFAYWTQGWLDHYLDGSLLAPFRYAQERVPGAEAMRRILSSVTVLGLALALALPALAAWRPRALTEPVGLLSGFALLWFVVASLAIAAPGFYFNHYFLLWLPSLSLLAAIGAWRLAQGMAVPARRRAAFAGLVGLLAADAWLAEIHHRVERGPGLFLPDPVRQVAAQVAAAAGPDGDAFIANYHPSVYVIAGVRVATRFPFPPHLTGVFEDLSDISTEAELERVLAARPRVIVVDRGWMHAMRPAAAAQVMAAVAAGYERFATVTEYRGPVEIWRLR